MNTLIRDWWYYCPSAPEGIILQILLFVLWKLCLFYFSLFRFASYWNVPVFTTGKRYLVYFQWNVRIPWILLFGIWYENLIKGGMEATFRDKRSTYSSLTCLGGDYGQFAKFFSSLMKMFSWHHITFIYNQNPAISGKGEMSMGVYFSGSPSKGGWKVKHQTEES